MAISKVRAKFNGTWYTLTKNSSTGNYEVTLTPTASSTGQPGGYYNVEVEATAADGTTATASGTTMESLRLVVQDTTPPTLTVTAPVNNLITTSGSVTVRGTASDNSGPPTVKVNGKTVTLSNGSFSTSVTLSEGRNTITVTATDADGNTSTVTRTVIKDTTAPALTVTFPPDGLMTNNAALTVTGSASDASSGIDSVAVNGTAVSNKAGAFSWPLGLVPGDNEIAVTATDKAGFTTTVTRHVLLDTIQPVLTLVSPPAGWLTDPRPEFVFAVTDDGGAGVDYDSITVELDGVRQNQGVASGAGRITFTPPEELSQDGHTLAVTVRDRAGNLRGLSVQYIVDSLPPELYLDHPNEHRVVDWEEVAIRGTVFDAGAGGVTVTINGRSVPLDEYGGFSLRVPLEVGENWFYVTAADRLGLTVTEEVYMIRLITDRTRQDVRAVKKLLRRAKKDGMDDWTEEERDWFNTAIIRGAYNDTDLNRVGTAIQYIARELVKRGYDVEVSARTDWIMPDVPAEGPMDDYLGDVNTLRNAQGTEIQGVPASMAWLSVPGANAIEKALVEVDAVFPNYRCWSSGEISSGES